MLALGRPNINADIPRQPVEFIGGVGVLNELFARSNG